MTNNLELKLTIVSLIIILILVLRVLAESETVVAWSSREFHKEARLPDRFPKPSRLRRIILFFLSL